MDVQMWHGFRSMRAVVDHDPESLSEIQFFRHLAGHEQQVAKRRFVLSRRFPESRNKFLGHDQEVNRSLRLDVVQDDTLVVLVLDFGGNFAIDDFLEDRLGHGGKKFPANYADRRESLKPISAASFLTSGSQEVGRPCSPSESTDVAAATLA
jgi:hypothetical protein